MEGVEKLLAEAEIKDLMYKRIRYMDTKQWHMYATVHTEDHVSSTYGGLPKEGQPETDGEKNKVQGHEALTNAIRTLMDEPVPMVSCHHVHSPEITFTSDTTAEGIWAMEDELWWPNGDKEESLHGWGHYEEKYRKENGKWLICYRGLTRLRTVQTDGFYDRVKKQP
ncbi:nuclear transport factor 2 family protein [Halieaceae bacterium]|jgi:hypothetical protein|nr:nuclear transport factor 2 family protein [Halieaceae bacterium]